MSLLATSKHEMLKREGSTRSAAVSVGSATSHGSTTSRGILGRFKRTGSSASGHSSPGSGKQGSTMTAPPSLEVVDMLVSSKVEDQRKGEQRLRDTFKKLLETDDFMQVQKTIVRLQEEFLFDTHDESHRRIGYVVMDCLLSNLDHSTVPRYINMLMATLIKASRQEENLPGSSLHAQSLMRLFQASEVCVFNTSLPENLSGESYIHDLTLELVKLSREARERLFRVFPTLVYHMITFCIDKRMEQDIKVRISALNLLAITVEAESMQDTPVILERVPVLLRFIFDGLQHENDKMQESASILDDSLRIFVQYRLESKEKRYDKMMNVQQVAMICSTNAKNAQDERTKECCGKWTYVLEKAGE